MTGIPDDALSTGIVFFGTTGSGKTTAAKGSIEHIRRHLSSALRAFDKANSTPDEVKN